MAYNNLRFFKDTENDLNLKTKSSSYSDSFLQGSVFLDEVSTGLYETSNIWMA